MAYLNVQEVESAIAQLGNQFPQYCTRITLPNATYENRTCHALRIRYNPLLELFPFSWSIEWLNNLFDSWFGNSSKQIVYIGGQHAREWVPPDALVFFCQKVIQCLQNGTTISLGSFAMSRETLKNVLQKVKIIVFPQTNPDGRNFSMTNDSMWRRNRRPDPDPTHMGVDLNRNYDFLWDFPNHFANAAEVASSTDPANETFIGPSPLSEPETRNVQWLVNDQKAQYFIDVHSFSGYLLYNWADDQSQNTDTAMNFRDNSYANVRGVKDDTAYREYMPAGDSDRNRHLAEQMRNAIAGVRGRNYRVQEWRDMYAASGTSTDYHQSLSFVDPRRRKIYAFCIECGRETFQPPLDERAFVVQEVTAALLQFARDVAAI